MRHWATADGHLWHKNILQYCHRNFSTIEEMNECLIEETNKVVKRDDILWYVGDLLFEIKLEPYIKKLLEWRDKIKCREVHLVLGNHDKKLYYWRKNKKVVPKDIVFEVFADVQKQVDQRINDQCVTFNHNCMLTWSKWRYGSIMLHGDAHGTLNKFKDTVLPNHRSLDVGVDSAFKILGVYRPFSLDEIVDILSYKQIDGSELYASANGETR